MNYADQYQQLSQTPMYLTRPLGLIEITGSSRLDLIDRMSTQKVKGLPAGTGAATVLTTDIGRIIDRLFLYSDDDRLLVVTAANNGENIIRYLIRFVFFNDDFHMRDLSQSHSVISLYGATAEALIKDSFDLDTGKIQKHHWRTVTLSDGTPITIHRTDPLGGHGYLLISPKESLESLKQQLNQAGAREIQRDVFGYFRVVEGLPLHGFEMTSDYIPLETGLWDDVSFNKGCYTGQEIIARMESRGRVAKKLVKLAGDGELSRGAEIMAAGKKVGTITSTLGGLALGYVKTSTLDNEASLEVDGATVKIRP